MDNTKTKKADENPQMNSIDMLEPLIPGGNDDKYRTMKPMLYHDILHHEENTYDYDTRMHSTSNRKGLMKVAKYLKAIGPSHHMDSNYPEHPWNKKIMLGHVNNGTAAHAMDMYFRFSDFTKTYEEIVKYAEFVKPLVLKFIQHQKDVPKTRSEWMKDFFKANNISYYTSGRNDGEAMKDSVIQFLKKHNI